MSGRVSPSFALLGVILVLAILQGVSGQEVVYAHLTSIDVTSHVAADKPLIITVTASYSYLTISEESLLISILDHTENGTPFATTSTDPSCYAPQNVSICLARIPNIPRDPLPQGTFTASFTLATPTAPETWNLCIFAQIVVPNYSTGEYIVLTSEFKVIPVTVTG